MGHVRPPADGREKPMKRPEPAAEDCDAFFMFIYLNLAEHLALAEDQDMECEELDMPTAAWAEWLALQDPRANALAAVVRVAPRFERRNGGSRT